MRRLISLGLLFAIGCADAAYVVTTSGRRVVGTRISATEEGAVTLTTVDGQTMTFQQGQYRAAKADRPRELAAAEKRFSAGDSEQAVALLRKVKAEYRFLEWDQRAIERLGQHYFAAERYAEAAAEFQLLERPSAEAKAALREAMIQSGDVTLARALLDEEIQSEDRAVVAKAYLARGDLKAAAGDAEGARRDWLKVAMFFKAERAAAAEAEKKLKE